MANPYLETSAPQAPLAVAAVAAPRSMVPRQDTSANGQHQVAHLEQQSALSEPLPPSSDSDDELMAAAAAFDEQTTTETGDKRNVRLRPQIEESIPPGPQMRHWASGAYSFYDDRPASPHYDSPTPSREADDWHEPPAAAGKRDRDAPAVQPGTSVWPPRVDTREPSGNPASATMLSTVTRVASPVGGPEDSRRPSPPAAPHSEPSAAMATAYAPMLPPPPKRPRYETQSLTDASGLLCFTAVSEHPLQLLPGLEFSSVAGPMAPPAGPTDYLVIPLNWRPHCDQELSILLGDQWVEAILGQLLDQSLAARLRKFPRTVLEASLQPFRFGTLPLHEAVLDKYMRNILRIWPAVYSNATRLRATKGIDMRIVRVGVVHVSTGHGTALGCAEFAVKFLQKALSQLHVLPILCSAQHLRMQWDGWGSGGGRIQMAHLWNPAGHSEPPFTHHQLDWHADNATTVAAMCRAECLDAAPHAHMLVLLLADLRPFDVEATIQAPTADTPQWSRLLSFMRWQSAFEKVVGPRNSVVKVFADMRKHSDATKKVLGQNLAATYEINAKALTAVDRPVTVCASPCAARGYAGATLGDLTGGARPAFLIPPVSCMQSFTGATLLDGSVWCPQSRQEQERQLRPVALTPEWPTLLSELSHSTDGADECTQWIVDAHRCALPQFGGLRHAGPAFYLHFLSWGDSSYAEILRTVPCIGKIFVATGELAPEVVPTVGHGDGVWTSMCGNIVLCSSCAAVVEAFGDAWERRSMADVIARHAAAQIVHMCCDIRSVDCRT